MKKRIRVALRMQPEMKEEIEKACKNIFPPLSFNSFVLKALQMQLYLDNLGEKNGNFKL